MALGEGGDHGAAALPLIADQAKHGGGGIVRSGSMWTAAAHVITAVIGSGVLSLAWSIAQLGWVAGPAAMLVFAAVTALQSTLFADCYRSPDPEHGPHRNRTYAKAVDRNLGSSSSWVCMLLQHTALFGYGIAYTITASISCSSSSNTSGARRRARFTWLLFSNGQNHKKLEPFYLTAAVLNKLVERSPIGGALTIDMQTSRFRSSRTSLTLPEIQNRSSLGRY